MKLLMLSADFFSKNGPPNSEDLLGLEMSQKQIQVQSVKFHHILQNQDKWHQVTLISGVCRAGVTPATVKFPASHRHGSW